MSAGLEDWKKNEHPDGGPSGAVGDCRGIAGMIDKPSGQRRAKERPDGGPRVERPDHAAQAGKT